MSRRGENIYKRKDGRYEGRYIKGRRMDGKPIFGYIYGKAYSDVKFRLMIAKTQAKTYDEVRTIGKGSMEEYLNYWLEHSIKGCVKASTYARYHERMQGHLLPYLGQTPVHKVSCEQIQNFIDCLLKKGLSPSTVSGIARLLRSAMKKAQELHLTNVNAFENVTMPMADIQEAYALSRTEQIQLERAADGEGGSAALGIFLSLYAGLRIGELCALRWRDVDFLSGTLTVRGTLQRIKDLDGGDMKTRLMECAPKSKNSFRRVPLPADMSGRLKQYGKNCSGDCYVLSGRTIPIEPRTLRSQFTRIASKVGLSVPFHTLRHTYATRCLEHNFDIQALSELLGHADASITMKIYAHSMFEHKKELAGRIRILSKVHGPQGEAHTADKPSTKPSKPKRKVTR